MTTAAGRRATVRERVRLGGEVRCATLGLLGDRTTALRRVSS